jgi:hypothetical protein
MADFFKHENMDFAIIGAFGLHAYGYSRATRDIDFLTRLSYQTKIITFLDSLGFETLQKTDAFSNHLHAIGNTRVDLMYIDGRTADIMFSDIRRVTLFGKDDLPVVSPEHLVALKLFAAQNDPQRKLKELADIQELLRHISCDMKTIHSYFVKYGFKESYEEVTGEKE